MSLRLPSTTFCEDYIDSDVLIKEVESRPVLYDKSRKDYQNANLKMKTWEEIGVNVVSNWENMSTAQRKEACKILQKRWKNLRDGFVRELRELKNKDPTKKRRKHFEKLLFLVPSVEFKDTPTSFVETILSENGIESSEDETSPNPKRRKEKSSEGFDVRNFNTFTEKNSADESFVSNFEIETDQVKSFAESIVPLLKQLPPQKILETEIEILQLINQKINHTFTPNDSGREASIIGIDELKPSPC